MNESTTESFVPSSLSPVYPARMGVHGLWQRIQAAEKVTTLQDLAVIEGYERNSRGHQTLVIGVDTDAIMSQCIAAAHANGHVHGPGHLQIFFFKLCKFLRSPITWIFVFDGPNRPAIKRGKVVNSSTAPSWVGPCKALIECFGFHIHQAPGEAEAELANLNSRGLIDVILTTDSDVFVFGGSSVLRSTSVKNKPTENADEMGLYTADAIEGTEGLTRGGLLLFALLSGGDYTAGLEGCGEVTAHGLAKCGFGDKLLTAFSGLSDKDLSAFLVSWVNGIRNELVSNSRGFLPSRRPALAATIPPEFPSLNVVRLYIQPKTTSFLPPGNLTPVNWKPQQIRINKLASFCANYLGWTEAAVLRKTFHSNVWEGVFLQMLICPWVLYDPKTHIMRTDNFNTIILELRQKQRQTRRQSDIGSWYRVRISTDGFIELMGLRYKTEGENELNVWVPTTLFPENMAPVGQGKTKKKRTEKRQTAKLEAPGTSKATVIPVTEPPVIDLPLFLPIPLPPRRSSVLGGIRKFGERKSTPYDTHSPRRRCSTMDLTIEDSIRDLPPTVRNVSYHRHAISPVIDLTVEDSSGQAESSAMGAQRRGIDDDIDIIYVSD